MSKCYNYCEFIYKEEHELRRLGKSCGQKSKRRVGQCLVTLAAALLLCFSALWTVSGGRRAERSTRKSNPSVRTQGAKTACETAPRRAAVAEVVATWREMEPTLLGWDAQQWSHLEDRAAEWNADMVFTGRALAMLWRSRFSVQLHSMDAADDCGPTRPSRSLNSIRRVRRADHWVEDVLAGRLNTRIKGGGFASSFARQHKRLDTGDDAQAQDSGAPSLNSTQAPEKTMEKVTGRRNRSAALAALGEYSALSGDSARGRKRLDSLETAAAPHPKSLTAQPSVKVDPGDRRRTRPVRRRRRRRRHRTGVRFRFALISDTHDQTTCGVGQGRWVAKAIRIINRLRPAFVVGVGDVAAGGGDCLKQDPEGALPDLEIQLAEFRENVLEKLEVPYVNVEGNHELSNAESHDPHYPRRTWEKFWLGARRFLLPRIRRRRYRRSYRFKYRGIGFVVLGYYGHWGLAEREYRWARRHIRKGDIVFRHVNLFGVSCQTANDCGFAIRNEEIEEYEVFYRLLKARRVKALISGHTHAFYHGVCGGLQFINNGSLGSRSMEYVAGWKDSPYRDKQAFAIVDVMQNRSLRVHFFVYDEACDCFTTFDPKRFPETIEVERIQREDYEEGVAATCRSIRK